ncbi:hypothetical protein GH733_001558, partial [Mirounga leonina]
MLPQQKPTGFPLSCALKFLFSSELNENVYRKTATHNLCREESLQKLYSEQTTPFCSEKTRKELDIQPEASFSSLLYHLML